MTRCVITGTAEWMTLTARQRALVALLSTGMSQREAREQLRYPDRAWYASLQDEGFRRCVSMVEQATMADGIRWAASKFRQVLEAMYGEALNPDNPPGVRVRAQAEFCALVSRRLAWLEAMEQGVRRIEAPATPALPEWARVYAAKSGT